MALPSRFSQIDKEIINSTLQETFIQKIRTMVSDIGKFFQLNDHLAR